jgi:hypothetical protein
VEEQKALAGPDPLPKPLMRSSLVEVHCIRIEETVELLLLEDQEVIQAFSSHTSQKAFTDGIRLGSSVEVHQNILTETNRAKPGLDLVRPCGETEGSGLERQDIRIFAGVLDKNHSSVRKSSALLWKKGQALL